MDDNKNNTSNNDVKNTLSAYSYLQSQSLIEGGKGLDKLAKHSSNIKTKREEKEEEGDTSKDATRLKTKVNDAVENDKEDQINKSSENKSLNKNDSISQETNETPDSVISSQDNYISRIRTNPNSTENIEDIITLTDISTNDEMTDTDKPEDTEDGNRIKTLANKLLKFNDNQGRISKTVSVVGGGVKFTGKAQKKLTATSRRVQTALNGDGTGVKNLKEDQNKITRKLAKRASKPTRKVLKKGMTKIASPLLKLIVNAFRTAIMSILKVLITAVTSASCFLIPVLICLALALLICTIFGFGGAIDGTVAKYETYMKLVQQKYDMQVDEWLQRNPEGIVVAIDGSYGRIDWRIPLAITQSISGNSSMDEADSDLLYSFDNAGLYEKHSETEIEVDIPNNSQPDENNSNKKKVKVLTITNPGYDDYMAYLSSHNDVLRDYRISKEVTEKNDGVFTKEEKEAFDKLRTSDAFFDEFSKDFQNRFEYHVTQTGENVTEKDFDTPEYVSLNPFTKSGFKGQCTWYVYGRALKLTGKKMPTGDAQTWIQSAKALALPTGQEPSKNAVIVLSGGTFGHVAFVEGWDGNKITVSEGNYNNPCASGQCDAVSYANVHYKELIHQKTYDSLADYKQFCSKYSKLTVIGFIYLD